MVPSILHIKWDTRPHLSCSLSVRISRVYWVTECERRTSRTPRRGFFCRGRRSIVPRCVRTGARSPEQRCGPGIGILPRRVAPPRVHLPINSPGAAARSLQCLPNFVESGLIAPVSEYGSTVSVCLSFEGKAQVISTEGLSGEEARGRLNALGDAADPRDLRRTADDQVAVAGNTSRIPA